MDATILSFGIRIKIHQPHCRGFIRSAGLEAAGSRPRFASTLGRRPYNGSTPPLDPPESTRFKKEGMTLRSSVSINSA